MGNFICCLVNELKRTNRFKFKAGEKNYKMKGLYRRLYTTLNYIEKKKRRKETRPLNDHDSECGRKSEAFIRILAVAVEEIDIRSCPRKCSLLPGRYSVLHF